MNDLDLEWGAVSQGWSSSCNAGAQGSITYTTGWGWVSSKHNQN